MASSSRLRVSSSSEEASLEELVFSRIDLSQEIGVIVAMKKAPLVS